jgi:hypothetical protein
MHGLVPSGEIFSRLRVVLLKHVNDLNLEGPRIITARAILTILHLHETRGMSEQEHLDLR